MRITPKDISVQLIGRINVYSRKVLKSGNPEYLHDLRVAMLKFEFAVETLHRYICLDKNLNKKLRSFRREMGGVRDLDILAKSYLNDPTLRELNTVKLCKKRERLIRILQSTAYQNLLQKLSRTEAINKSLSNSWMTKQLVSSFKAVLKERRRLDSKRGFHKTRIAIKKLRYLCEFFKKSRPIRPISQLQDILGVRQDAISNIAVLTKMAGSQDIKNFKGIIKTQKNIVRNSEKKFRMKWKQNAQKIHEYLQA